MRRGPFRHSKGFGDGVSRRTFLAGASTWALGGVLGCRDASPQQTRAGFDLTQAVTPPLQPKLAPFVPPRGMEALRLAVTPHLDPEQMRQSYEPLVDWIENQLGIEVDVLVTRNYDALGKRMRQGKADLGVFSPFAFVRAEQLDPGLQPVVNVISDGSETSACYIVVRSDSHERTLEDLRGKRMAFVDPASTSGYLFPMKLLLDRGVNPRTFFSEMRFFGNHAESLLALIEQRTDAAATYQGAIRTLARWSGVDPLSFRIIAKGGRTPHNLVVARSGLPSEIVVALRERLLSLSVQSPEGRRILRPIDVNGFVPPLTRLYASVREANTKVTDAGYTMRLPRISPERPGDLPL